MMETGLDLTVSATYSLVIPTYKCGVSSIELKKSSGWCRRGGRYLLHSIGGERVPSPRREASSCIFVSILTETSSLIVLGFLPKLSEGVTGSLGAAWSSDFVSTSQCPRNILKSF